MLNLIRNISGPIIDITIKKNHDYQDSEKGVTNTVGCSIDGSVGIPTPGLTWNGNQLMNHGISQVEGFKHKYITYADISDMKHGTLMCYFADKRGNYSLSRTLLIGGK